MRGGGDDLANIQRVRRTLVETGPGHSRAGGDFERVSLPQTDCDTLRDVLLDERVRVVVEVGLAYGSSTLAIGEALVSQGHEDPRLVVVDAYQDQFGHAGLEVITNAGLGEISTFIAERSQLALPRLVADGVSADAAFVDGSHIFHNVFVDLYFLRELVRPGGLIILDDYEWLSVATAVEYFARNTAWQQVALPGRTRLRAFRLPDPRVEPSFEDFTPFGTLTPDGPTP